MGQYYKPIFLTENNKPKAFVDTHDFGSGLKLMEHSWLKNPMVRFIEKQLMVEPQKVVWAGDYADNEDPKKITSDEIKALADETSEYWNAEKLRKEGINLYFLANCVAKLIHDERMDDKYNHNFSNQTLAPLTAKYLVNHDKKEFVNKTKVPKDSGGWRIHPLPLLTCEGNGRGGGDFNINDERKQGNVSLIGSWSRNKIGVVSKKSDIPKDYKELVFDLVER
jgi:hypothetical protein